MKTATKLMAGALIISAATMAQAQTVIHITGSTAFRKATMVGIEHSMGTFAGAYVQGSGITSELNAKYSILRGNVSGVGDTIFKCTWTGSVGGVQTVVQNLPVSTWLANSVLPGSGVISLGSGTFDAAAPADVAMSDSKQSSTGFGSPILTVGGTGHNSSVGVIAFEWVANYGSPSTLNNITPLQAQQLATSLMQLSQFTGNPADAATAIYLAGRNFDSGTRLDELAEAGIGVFGNVQQVQPTISGTPGPTGNITALDLWPSETVLGIFFDVGQSGYNSGGDLANAMATPGSLAAGGSLGGGYMVAYLGLNDAAAAITAPSTAHIMTYNGVAYSPAAIQEGSYTCWSYEWLLYRNTLTGLPQTAADKLADQIRTADANQSGILLGSMHVSRATEGGVISHN